MKKSVEQDRLLFEFDGAFRPTSLLPGMLPAMRDTVLRASAVQWLEANSEFKRDVLARLRGDGPLQAADIADTAQVSKPPDGWTGSNQVPTMLDLLARLGEGGIVGREGRHRLWDVADRAYSHDIPELSSEEASTELEQRALRAAGLARAHHWWSGVGKE